MNDKNHLYEFNKKINQMNLQVLLPTSINCLSMCLNDFRLIFIGYVF